MIPSWARKGVKVVCVNGQFISPWLRGILVEGQQYTIAGTGISSGAMGVGGDTSPHATFELEELEHPDDYPGMPHAPGFDARRFRPLVAPKTEAEDAEFFRHWLTAPQHSTASETEHAVDA